MNTSPPTLTDASLRHSLYASGTPTRTDRPNADSPQQLERDIAEYIRHGGVVDDLIQCLQRLAGQDNLVSQPTRDVPTTALEDRRSYRDAGSNGPRHLFHWGSPAAKLLYAQIERVADLDSSVLLTGESGTGKSSIARMIHERSSRHAGPFISVKCASLPNALMEAKLFGHVRGAFNGAVEDRPGCVEAADGGTLFLDEIGDLPVDIQPKLLTFLQEHTFHRIGSNESRRANVRVISASHRNLLGMSAENRFRRDLYFRLAVLRLDAPTLRDRKVELAALSRRILDRIARQRKTEPLQLSPDALAKLEAYDWPGNIRELDNVLSQASAFAGANTISTRDIQLPEIAPAEEATRSTASLAGQTLAAIEQQAIIDTLALHNGNKARTARSLGISEKTIYNKLRRHGLKSAKKTSPKFSTAPHVQNSANSVT